MMGRKRTPRPLMASFIDAVMESHRHRMMVEMGRGAVTMEAVMEGASVPDDWVFVPDLDIYVPPEE